MLLLLTKRLNFAFSVVRVLRVLSHLSFSTGSSISSSSSRSRISNYVASGQQFLVVDPNVDQTIILYEDPNAEMVTLSRVHWFCQPKHAPDLNGDGNYDNVISHSLTFRPHGVKDIVSFGATVSGDWTPHGYVAAWNEGIGTYEELVVDYDDKSVGKLYDSGRGDNVASFLAWEYSGAGEIDGFVSSGVGEWVSDLTDPRLVEMSEALGKNLTGENCDAKYAEVWEAANKV